MVSVPLFFTRPADGAGCWNFLIFRKAETETVFSEDDKVMKLVTLTP